MLVHTVQLLYCAVKFLVFDLYSAVLNSVFFVQISLLFKDPLYLPLKPKPPHLEIGGIGLQT